LLFNYPGHTPTMAITPSSSAFNTADQPTSLPTDQRGEPRPSNGGYDIGAFQYCVRPFPFTDVCPPPLTIAPTEPLTIQVAPADGGTTTPAAGSYNEILGSVVGLTATSAPGFTFVNWTGAVADLTNPSTTIIMDNAQMVTANFAPVACVNNLSGRGTAGLFNRPDRIDLTWTAFGNATSYNVLRGTSAGGENPVPIGTTATPAYTDNNVIKGRTYYYELQPASNGAAECTSNEAAVLAP
jgi:uncharacterized repeat protein (TIGR02543 family)